MTPVDWRGITHFEPSEFANPGKMGVEFMVWLDGVREQSGVPMHVSSDYRTKRYNKDVGGAANSAHCDLPCNAVDLIKTPTVGDPNWNRARGAIIRAAHAAGCVRVGFYPNGSLHLDRSEDRRPAAMWYVVDHPAE